jgi:hypothetical protein
MLAGAERHARSDDPEPGPYPEPRDGERAVIHDAIPDGDLARRRSVMVGAPVPRQLPSFHGALVNRTFRSHPDGKRTTKQYGRIHKYEIRTYSCKHHMEKQYDSMDYLD